MWLSKRPRRIFYKRRQSQTAQEILDRLRDYLDNPNSEPVEILSQFWQDQQAAISYQELRAIVAQGYLDEITARLWEQDYSLLGTERLPKMWTDVMIAVHLQHPDAWRGRVDTLARRLSGDGLHPDAEGCDCSSPGG